MLVLASFPPELPAGWLVWPLCRWAATADEHWQAYDDAMAGLIADVMQGYSKANAIVNVSQSVTVDQAGRFTVLMTGNPLYWPGLGEASVGM
jgi:hypothetical protein